MVLFGLLRKDKIAAEPPLKKRIRDLKCRKVSFVDCDFEELERGMKSSCEYILKLTPVNYYAVKNNYILASLYSSEDFGECYAGFKRISYEKVTDESELYVIDGETAVRTLAKVGIIIDLKALSERGDERRG